MRQSIDRYDIAGVKCRLPFYRARKLSVRTWTLIYLAPAIHAAFSTKLRNS
jgi:hypothetical protein